MLKWDTSVAEMEYPYFSAAVLMHVARALSSKEENISLL